MFSNSQSHKISMAFDSACLLFTKMNPPQVYMCSPSCTLLPPPSPFHPSGLSQCTSPKHPVSNLDWQLVSCIFECSKITADGDCSHEIKRHLILGRKAMTNLDSNLKSRDICFPTKVHLVKSIVLPVVMYGGENWIIKKAEHWRIDAFEMWYWRRHLRVPWTARRSNQSILKEVSPEYSFEGLMLKLKLQNFGHLIQRADSFEKTLRLGKLEGGRRRGRQRMRWLVGWHHWLNADEFE